MYIFTKKKFYFFLTAIIALTLTIVLVGCNFTNANSCVDNRIHNIDFVTAAIENTGFNLESYNETKTGFTLSGTAQFKKSQLTGIQYVGTSDSDVEVSYNATYEGNDNTVELEAEAEEVDYLESLKFSPDLSEKGKFDGTIYIEGQAFNVFELEDEESEEAEECALFTGIVIGGIALWKIIAGITVATVAATMVCYPEYYVKGLEKVAEGLETAGKVITGGMTFILTQATSTTIARIKSNTDSKKYDKYYPTYIVNKANISNFKHASIGDTLISKYPVSKSQAIKNFKAGIHNYTTYAQDAKYIIGRVWWFDKITHDQPSKIGEFPHYHSSKGYVNNYHMHSFYGTAL